MKLCNLDTAQALQKLGYDGYYNYIYAKNTESSLRYIGFKEVFELSEYTGPPAPRLDDADYWIRDKYSIFIDLRYTRENIRKGSKRSWAYILKEMDSLAVQYGDSFYCSYELALEAAVSKAIEIINSRNKSERESNKNKKNR